MVRKLIMLLYKGIRYLKRMLHDLVSVCQTTLIFNVYNVKHGNYKTKGVPFVSVAKGGILSIGNNFVMNNIMSANPIGRIQKCSFVVGKDGIIQLGNNAGVSATAIVAHKRIIIGDNVKIGGGVCIYDTDFHSLKSQLRNDRINDKINTVSKDVIIGDNVFIGAHSTILKGVSIGENSIVGACSVVSKSIPSNEIWAGNPAKLIRRIYNE